MSESKDIHASTKPLSDIDHHITYLKLSFIADQYAPLATQAAQKQW